MADKYTYEFAKNDPTGVDSPVFVLCNGQPYGVIRPVLGGYKFSGRYDSQTYQSVSDCQKWIENPNPLLSFERDQVVMSWRGGKTVQRIRIRMSGDDLRRMAREFIIEHAKTEGIPLPVDVDDQESCDTWLSIMSIGDEWDAATYKDHHVCHVEFSYYVEIPRETAEKILEEQANKTKSHR